MSMDAWAEVSGLTFTATASGADPDIDFNEDNGENGGRQAFTNSRISIANGTLTSVTVTISANWDTNPDGSADYALNSRRYQTYLHEVGHALGLGHSGLYNGPRVDEAGVSHHVYNQDAWNYTVMSYRHQGEAGTGTPRLVLTPQLVDIIAIQNFYGANGQTRSGDNVYGFNSTETGVLDFEETFFNQGIRPPSLAIYDAGGTDTLDFSLYSANQVISLVEGSFSSIGDNILTNDPEDPLINNITIAVGTVIENAIGGSGDDSFTGNDSDNVFIGNGGNDTYAGGAGNDMVILELSQSRYIISVDETNEGRFLVIAGGTEGTDRINLADVEFVGFDDGQTIVTTASLADPIEFDDDGDGNIDRRVHLNADGRWARVERDLDDDGTIDRITHFAFDDGGTRRVTRREIDLDDDGTINRTVHLNAEGRWERLEQDLDDDGTIDRITHYAFDDDGTRRLTRRDFDRDDDGTIDRIAHLNAEGRWERVERDLDDDGTIDRITHYAFDDGGTRRVTRRDFDLDDDGTIDRTIHLNAEGRWERVEWDDDDDGMADRIHHYTFDSDGRRTRIDFDDDGDGTTDRSEFYTQNADGNRDRTNFDDDADGTIDRSETYTYNANGRVSQTDFDDNNDGTTDRNEIYTYDVNGRLIQTDFDDNNDGTIDRSERAPSSLDGINGFTLTGIDANDQSGLSVSSAGDVNGDGYDDLIIGARYADPNRDSSGETYIVYGGANAPGTNGVLDLSGLDGTNGFILSGIDAFDYSGWSVSSAGDVNGDGYDDLIIGARDADPNGNFQAGETYIVYGGASAPGTNGVLDLSGLDGTNGFILSGIDAFDYSGWSVSSAGDVNGDGYDDLIIGANRAGPNGDSYAGETYVVYGGASAPGRDGVLDLSALDGTNGFILTGIDGSDNSGRSVSSAGDVNGDGYDDLIIGANRADPNGNYNAGETYVIYGGASAPDGVLDLSSLNGTNGFILTGIDAGDSSGISVSSAGDVNGDGYDDLIIGAHRADPNGDGSGETYLVYGGASAPGTDGMLDLSSLNGTNGFILSGIDAFDYSGWSVSSAGDVNGDGYDDLIIGAFRADPNGNDNAGETYVVYGGASAPGRDGVLDLSALDGTNGFILTGIDAYDSSGISVSSAGDVNGDGYDDLIIGASGAEPNGDSGAGETYIVYGGATGTESLTPVTAQGMAAADNFTGNAGDDNFTAIATNDVVRGGAGNDMISVTSLDFAAIDGGTGADTLVLDGAGLALDLTGAGHAGVDSVEVFDLSGTGANSLVLDALAVFDVTEEREGGAASLDVRGDADDRVELSGRSFALTGTAAEDGVTYNIYRDGNAQLRIETGVQVVTIPVFTSPAAVSVAEGQTAAYEAAATDDEGDPLVYSLSGTDAALFTINANTGEVSFIAAPDFEMPGDADGDNVYDITVTASDGDNNRNHNVAIRVTNENDNIPVFTSPAAVSAQENRVAAYEAAATDADGDPLVYRLSGTDAALFRIGSTTGEVRFRVAPDFEDPDDADGDNVYDITVTASDGTNSTNHNVAIRVTDEENDPVNLSRLDGTNGFTLTGIDAGDWSGASVSSAGDVNGDGYDDLIIGTWRAGFGGETYIVYGGANAPGTEGVLDLSGLDGSNGFILTGINRGDRSGFSISSAGDVNGDGYDDLIIGAPGTDGFTGETYIVYGGASAPGTNGVLDLGALDGTNGFILTGIDANDLSGRSVSSAGDVNGDGYDDLIIGARNANLYGRRNTGETYVVYGGASAPGTDGVLDLSGLDGTNGFILNGFSPFDRSGQSVSSAGDVNGDGYDDLIIGAYWADPNGDREAGETYIVYGGASAPGTGGRFNLSDLDGTNGFILNGIDAGDNSGFSVSSAGDVNGDGYDDLIIGANRADPNGDSEAGETYIVYGGATAPGTDGVLDLEALDGTNGFILTGIDAGDESGFSVSSAGDVNGDGYDDLIIGARFADPNGDSEAGETYVVYGGASAPGEDGELNLGALDGTNGFILAGIDARDQSGFSVSSAGDVNGDGYDDLIIGANRANPNGDSNAGETYVIYGGATGTESLVPVTAQGMAAADNFTGNAGDDNFTAIAANDVVRGGAGNDIISVTALDFAAIDGGTGADTLVLDGAGLALYLTGAGHASVDSVEVFDLSGTGANSLVLDTQAVFDVTEEREGGAASLGVRGDADDRVGLIGSNFALTGTATEDGVTYNIYRDGNAQLRVETGVQVQILVTTIPVFTSPAAVSARENQTAAYEAAAADADGDPLVYSLSGTDAALFTINANTGEVSFIAAPDFEMPGDADGDNVYDITVTAFDGTNRTDHNVAITVTDGYDPVNLASLDGSNGFILTGIDAGDQSGWSVSSARDVNGDGYDDLIIGAWGADPNGDSQAGETYVVYGGARAPGTDGELDLSMLDGSNGFTLTGIDANDRSGRSVSSAGDVNGDGYDDLIIGARLADPNGDIEAGETYIVYGGASAPGIGGVLNLGALDGSNGFTLTGINRGDQSGVSVSSAGDVNGDGYDDLIIGANRADPNGDSYAGETYIVYGGANAPGRDGVLDLSMLDGTNGFILTGIDADDRSGSSVSSAGDVNGDGYDDLIIGANRADPNGNDNAGETYVIYGGAIAPGDVLDLSSLNGTNGFILTGIDAGDSSGISVSSAGDVNGDGYDDLIIGARLAAPNGDDSGETYIVYGGASAPGTGGVLDLSDLDGSNGFILNGTDAGDLSGGSVSSAGDVNGDGYDDLIIGANRADPNGDSNAGETYLIYGGASAPGTGGVLDLSDLDGSNGFILTGIDEADRSGRSVSSAGDVNGDGYDDLIIGAYAADPDGDMNAGETYILYGGATGTESLVPVTAQGTAAADNFTGNAGDDSFTAIATNDVVRGGAGDDTIRITALDFAAIDGGTGQDTLVLDGAGLALDLTGAGHASVDSVEVFDLSGTGANSLVLDALAVFDVTEEREGGAASLDVLGDADDRVELSGSSFALTGTAAEDGVTYNVYRDGNAQLRVETGVQVVTVPVFTSPSAVSVAENQVAAYEAAATDDEGDALVYNLSGTDAALFTINANTGEVSFIAAPDFEMPGDADGDNVYDITVTASDGDNSRNHNVAIRVTNENDNIPVFTSPAAVSVQENRMTAYEAAATDADGDPLVYRLSGTDAALFRIGSTTGEVRFRVAPDFEDPDDAGGDNVYDITVTASDGLNRTDHNVAITVTDGYDPVNLSSLDGTNGFTLNGIDEHDQSGASVSSAGDVNGDGYDDLIIGANRAVPNGRRNTGETYVVYGGASAPGTDGVLDLSDLDGTNGFILNGIDAVDYSGSSVSSAGDVNGDGYDDLIIGAPGVGSMQDEFDLIRGPGETYVVYGGASAPGTGGVLDLSGLDGTNGFILNGIDAGDQSGFSVSSAGDVNGDGYDDLIIGAFRAAPDEGFYSGETYVVYGGASAPGTEGVLDLGALDGTNGFILTGIDAFDNSGFSVSSAGDVNGDGYDDLIIGARYAEPNGNNFQAGETYIIYGGASAPGTGGRFNLSDLDGTNGFILAGIDAGDLSGFSVSSAGDVNGDGYDDLIIGATRAGPNGDNQAGETYVVYGGASAPGTGGVLDLSALDGTNGFILTGIDTGDQSGTSVSSAGDVNGDGYDDLIIGAYWADPNGDNRAGETYLVYGGASAPGEEGVLDLGALDGSNGFILTGIDATDNAGQSVSSAGDVNGDGYDDLIIGAWLADPNGISNAGETYIVYGGATGTESLVPVTASGTAAADNFTGNAGADSFTGIATDDVVRGGAGDDMISITALDFAAIDGGTGVDTLVLDGAGLSLDLTGAGHVGLDSVELFDLSGTGANSLVLDALAVFDVTEERAGGVASLDVLGDADDRVDLSGSSFALTGTAAEDGVTYNVYRDGNAEVRIENGVMVTLAATGSQSARFKTDAKIDTKTETGIDPVADPRTDTRTDPESGTRLDEALMNPDPLMNNDLWNNDLWDGLWADGVRSLDQPVHIDEDAILIPLSDPLSFGPLASGPLPGPWGDLMCWPGLENHPAMQNDLTMILPEMEIVTAYMEGF